MNYLIIFVLITIMFFLGFGIGLIIPFLLKKYFNMSENDIKAFNKLKNECSNYFSEINKKIDILENNSYDEISKSIDEMKKDISNLSKTRNYNQEIMNEWFTGEKGDVING